MDKKINNEAYTPKIQREDYSIKNMIPFYHLGRQYLDIIENFEFSSILIIGIGDGMLPYTIKKFHKNATIKTVDMDLRLNPDYNISVHELSKINECFDIVVCANVLEHLPFKYFEKSLLEIKKVATKGVIITLPYAGLGLITSFKMTPFFQKTFLLKIPYFFKKHKFDGEHYWEIGTRGYSLKKIKQIIKENGYIIEKSYFNKNWDYCYHFILKIKR